MSDTPEQPVVKIGDEVVIQLGPYTGERARVKQIDGPNVWLECAGTRFRQPLTHLRPR